MTSAYLRAFGLQIETEILLPDVPLLTTPDVEATSDVCIDLGETPVQLEEPVGEGITWAASPGEFLLTIPDIARYWVRSGTHITITPATNSCVRDIITFLINPTLGALLHQRKLLALRGGAFVTDAGAVLVIGHSAVGKSVLLSMLHQQGYPLLTDGLLCIDLIDRTNPQVLPGLPYLVLWKDMIERLGLPLIPEQQVRPPLEKYRVSIDNFSLGPQPIRQIIILSQHNRPEITQKSLRGTERFTETLRYIYHKEYLEGFGLYRESYAYITSLARQTPITEIVRSSKWWGAEALLVAVEETLAA